MILHEFSLSSASYRVRIALNMKGLTYEKRSYRLRAGEHRSADYLALNPAGLVPMLEVGGGVNITQSLAIIDYLEAMHPEPRLIPSDALERAQVLAMALTVACDIHPLNNLRVLQYLETEMLQNEAARAAWYSAWVSAGFETLESMLKAKPTTRYASGAYPGLADICLVPQVYNARRYNVDLSHYPRLMEVTSRAGELDAFAKAAPVN